MRKRFTGVLFLTMLLCTSFGFVGNAYAGGYQYHGPGTYEELPYEEIGARCKTYLYTYHPHWMVSTVAVGEEGQEYQDYHNFTRSDWNKASSAEVPEHTCKICGKKVQNVYTKQIACTRCGKMFTYYSLRCHKYIDVPEEDEICDVLVKGEDLKARSCKLCKEISNYHFLDYDISYSYDDIIVSYEGLDGWYNAPYPVKIIIPEEYDIKSCYVLLYADAPDLEAEWEKECPLDENNVFEVAYGFDPYGETGMWKVDFPSYGGATSDRPYGYRVFLQDSENHFTKQYLYIDNFDFDAPEAPTYNIT